MLPDKKEQNLHSMAKLLMLLKKGYSNADVAMRNYSREPQNMNQDVDGLVFLKVFLMMQLKQSKTLHMEWLELKSFVQLVMHI